MQTIFSLSMTVLNLRSYPRIVVYARPAVVAEWLRLALRGWRVLSSNPSDGHAPMLGAGLHSLPPLEAGHFSPTWFFPCSPSSQPELPDRIGNMGVLLWPANAVRQVEHTDNTEKETIGKPCCELRLPKQQVRSFPFFVVNAPSRGSVLRLCMRRCGASTLHMQKSPSPWRMCEQ